MLFTVSDQAFPVLINSPTNVVIVAGAPARCAACVAQHQIMSKFMDLVKAHTGHYPPLYFADVEQNPVIDHVLGQNGVPRGFTYRDGKQIANFIGILNPNQLEELLLWDMDPKDREMLFPDDGAI